MWKGPEIFGKSEAHELRFLGNVSGNFPSEPLHMSPPGNRAGLHWLLGRRNMLSVHMGNFTLVDRDEIHETNDQNGGT